MWQRRDFFSKVKCTLTKTIGGQLDATSTENSRAKVNITDLMNKKLKYTMNTCRSSLIQWQRKKTTTMNLLKRQF